MGVAITKHGELGVSPISSVANVMSSSIDALSLGIWLIIWNCMLILGQIIILKKDFHPIQLLQIPLSFLFGVFTDFGMWCVAYTGAELWRAYIACDLRDYSTGFGVSLSVVANVIMNSGEAFVKAISR